MAKVLVMTFGCADGKEWAMTLPFPKENLTKAQVDAAMDVVIDKDIFTANPVSIVGSAYVERTETALV